MKEVDLPLAADAPQLRVYTAAQTSLAVHCCTESASRTYVWGTPRHSTIPSTQIPAWCASVVARDEFATFRELLGPFVAIVDEPRRRRITFVSDPLGIRPMFLARRDGRVVFGSDVWLLHRAGLTPSALDYDAIASWLAYRYNCTGGSIFAGVERLPAGSAVIVENGRTTTVRYVEFPGDDVRPTSVEDAACDVHEILASATKSLLADRERVTIPLSGGFDSRYLLALCLRERAAVERIVNVSFEDREGEVARRVAETMGVTIDIVPVRSSVWDLYESVHHFSPDGFPVSKFVTHLIAGRHPGVPMVNGFLGDSLLRGSNDTLEGQYEDELTGELADALQEKHLAVSLNLFTAKVADGIRARSRVPMETAVRHGGGKVFAWADLYFRQRHYISNNFQQHLGLAEAVLPFYNPSSIAYKMRHHHSTFGRHLYASVFSRYFPRIAGLPHASDIPQLARRAPLADCVQRWARHLVRTMCRPDSMNLLAKDRCIPLMILGASRLAGLSQRLAYIVEDAVLTCERVYLLESRVRAAQVEFEWSRL